MVIRHMHNSISLAVMQRASPLVNSRKIFLILKKVNLPPANIVIFECNIRKWQSHLRNMRRAHLRKTKGVIMKSSAKIKTTNSGIILPLYILLWEIFLALNFNYFEWNLSYFEQKVISPIHYWYSQLRRSGGKTLSI